MVGCFISPGCLNAVGLGIDLPQLTVIVGSSYVVDRARLARLSLTCECPSVRQLWLTKDKPDSCFYPV